MSNKNLEKQSGKKWLRMITLFLPLYAASCTALYIENNGQLFSALQAGLMVTFVKFIVSWLHSVFWYQRKGQVKPLY